MNKKMILIGGYLATGKSTFADRLSDALHIPYFDKDTTKEVLAEDIGESHMGAIRRLSLAAFSLMYCIAERQMQAGAPFVLESNFRRPEVERLHALAAQNGYECLMLIFVGDFEGLFARYSARDAGRHWVHKSKDRPETCASYKDENLQFGDIAVGERVHYVDMTTFDAARSGELIGIVSSFLAGD